MLGMRIKIMKEQALLLANNKISSAGRKYGIEGNHCKEIF